MCQELNVAEEQKLELSNVEISIWSTTLIVAHYHWSISHQLCIKLFHYLIHYNAKLIAQSYIRNCHKRVVLLRVIFSQIHAEEIKEENHNTTYYCSAKSTSFQFHRIYSKEINFSHDKILFYPKRKKILRNISFPKQRESACWECSRIVYGGYKFIKYEARKVQQQDKVTYSIEMGNNSFVKTEVNQRNCEQMK